MKKKVNIGFDIGITSVGWAIVDEENNIIDRGVRLFEELKNPKDGSLKNVNRRSKRSGRRMISRRKNRKNDFIKLITRKYFDIFKIESFEDFDKTKQNFIEKIIGKETNKSVLDLILKGLNQELKPLELARVLYYYLSHRGYSYMTLEQWEKKETIYKDIQNKSEIKEFAEWYEQNASKENEPLIKEKLKNINYKELNIKTEKSFLARVKEFNSKKEYLGKYPSVIQKMEFEKYGYFRGNEKINSEFSKIQWQEEIKKVLENQKYLPSQFIIDYLGDGKENLGIFNRLRKFSAGPGSEKSPTKYGLYRKENGKIEKKAENLWDLLIGKCSVYPDLDRANKKSCSSEIANILNQLNTIAINDSKRGNSWLSEKEKKEIIFKMVSVSKNPLLIIKEVCQLDNIGLISKYPTKESKANKSTDNQNLEKLDNTKILFQILGSKYSIKNYDDLIDKKDFFNKIIDIFARFPKQYEAIEKELNLKIDDINLVEELVLKSDKINSQSTSSMSYKALDLYIKEEIVDHGKTLNQKYKSKIDENEMNKFQFDFSKSKYINEDCLDDQAFVLSPTTKCSFREMLKVFNKILKRYIYNPSNHTKQTYHLKNIVMEMPTEWNSKDERDRKTKVKNANEERKKKAKDNYGYDGDDKTIINKLNLLYSQNNKDVYTGKVLDSDLVINDPNYSEIDHIIPYSISYDDSWNNKVLVHRTSNQEKRNKTPREYLGSSFFTFKKMWEELFMVEGNEFFNKTKFENLCLDVKSDDYRRRAGFIGRNLADTRYACRIGKQALDAWISESTIKNNLSSDDINIITVNGKYTQRYRSEKFLNLKKNREEDYSHHAIDATICAILGNSNDDVGKLVFFREIDSETGEIKSTSKFLHLNPFKKEQKSDSDIPWKDIADSVQNSNVKFSYKIHKKSNFGFWGDTIISVKKERDDKGKEVFNQYKKVKLLEIDFSKSKTGEKNEFEDLIEFYDDGKKYPDPKLWNDLMKAYNEGLKIKESNKEYEKENPFKLYMKEYCANKGIKDYKKMKSVLLERDEFKYSVSAIKKTKDICSFSPVKNYINQNKFGAYTGLDWKEIRLFKNTKGIYKIIPIRIDLYKDFSKNIFDFEKYNDLKKEFDINLDNDNYFTIHKGTLMISKTDKKDIRKIAGGNFSQHKLDIQEIYKESKQNNVAITTIMKNYDFCTIDELGNINIIEEKDLKL